MHQVSSQNGDVVVSPDPLVHVTVISNMETSLAATLSPSSGLTISQHGLTGNSNTNDLSVNAMVPQVTLPDQILQSQSDEPAALSPTETSVMMVSENPMSVTATLEHPENWLSSWVMGNSFTGDKKLLPSPFPPPPPCRYHYLHLGSNRPYQHFSPHGVERPIVFTIILQVWP